MKSILFGKDADRMPDFAFRMMSVLFKVMDLFSPKDKAIDGFGIQSGFTVMDYGCGPGRHIRRASQLSGSNGKVYAVDIHELAIASVEKLVEKNDLKNVTALLAKDIEKSVMPKSIDLIYALDMFHMVSDPGGFLNGIHRMIKPGGTFILEDGHQPRTLSRQKVMQSGCWKIIEETSEYMKCMPA